MALRVISKTMEIFRNAVQISSRGTASFKHYQYATQVLVVRSMQQAGQHLHELLRQPQPTVQSQTPLLVETAVVVESIIKPIKS
ncbi:hypothetical protein ABH905_005195 [Pseudomonas frederiksbergensis]